MSNEKLKNVSLNDKGNVSSNLQLNEASNKHEGPQGSKIGENDSSSQDYKEPRDNKNICVNRKFSFLPSQMASPNSSVEMSTNGNSFTELDDVFGKVWKRMKINQVESSTSEKLKKVSRAMNLIFKSKLIEVPMKGVKIYKNYSMEEMKKVSNKEGNIFKNNDIIFNSNYCGKGLTSTIANSIVSSNNLTINSNKGLNFNLNMPTAPNTPSFATHSIKFPGEKNFLGKKRLAVLPNQNSNEYQKTSADLIKNDISRILTEKACSESNTYQKQTPINIKSYPSSISLDTPQQQPNNIHLNMNITNININQKNHPLMKNIQPMLKCVRDLKLITELKECLRRKSIKFTEEHYSSDYVLDFKIPYEDIIKQFQITINCETSKIINYQKFKGEEKVIIINNTEDSDANLIFNELSNIRKDIEKSF